VDSCGEQLVGSKKKIGEIRAQVESRIRCEAFHAV
jgi:hypothetical protein